ncbi:MAG: hypothetical protein A3F72_05415 [Bacteroidetes bacterium RIFCSPLOWO2_12_FULL_35_15]|nr:MAG: hypothetical protein A3F72_05415 [Bacteroidetes bacterium RIFCSPLOWO2_12_FULL_35_15]
MTNEEKINLIGKKILLLSNNLDKYQAELNLLKQQLDALQQGQVYKQQPVIPPVVVQPILKTPEPLIEIPEIKKEIIEIKPENTPVTTIQEPIKPVQQTFQNPPPVLKQKAESNFNFEEFIGGKLITVIGIIILVIGLAIGVKYAIDNDMLGPLARIVLAYVAAGILLAVALKLKSKYKAFSAVLLSGGMASLYFTTYVAYSMYENELGFHQIPAFIIMVIFTLFTVFAATVYELEIIGIIGLVGAYAVPMLLSDGRGKIEIMFSYMVIINAGILILSFKKYWQVLNHIAFGFTWLIVCVWFVPKYNYEVHATMMLTFSFLFFIIFYISNMSYKILKQEKFGAIDIIRLVLNSFIFFAFGYAALNNPYYKDYLGAFTLCNAVVHLVFSFIVFRNKLLDRKLFYLLIALVLSFITIAVPVQLESNWVTLFWATEAVLLFAIGRFKAVRFYEWLAYIMILLASLSLWEDWSKIYFSYRFDLGIYKFMTPFANIYMLTSLFVVASLGTIIYIHHKKSITEAERKTFMIYKVAEYILPVLLFILTYYTFSNELIAYFKLKYEQSMVTVPSKEVWAEPGALLQVYDESILLLKSVVLIIYNFIFFILFTVLTIRFFKTAEARWVNLGLNLLTAVVFIFFGLNQLGHLRQNYLSGTNSEYFNHGPVYVYSRYICFALFFLFLYLTHLLCKTDTFQKFTFSKFYSGCIIHFFIIVVLSNELIHLNIMNNFSENEDYFYGSKAAYKLGLTALFGIYSFLLIAYGMYRKNKIMRVSAITLFGITLVKLLTFDTWDLSTGYKVIAYMLLGVILLVVAFLYQKFKVLIFGDDNQNG